MIDLAVSCPYCGEYADSGMFFLQSVENCLLASTLASRNGEPSLGRERIRKRVGPASIDSPQHVLCTYPQATDVQMPLASMFIAAAVRRPPYVLRPGDFANHADGHGVGRGKCATVGIWPA